MVQINNAKLVTIHARLVIKLQYVLVVTKLSTEYIIAQINYASVLQVTIKTVLVSYVYNVHIVV